MLSNVLASVTLACATSSCLQPLRNALHSSKSSCRLCIACGSIHEVCTTLPASALHTFGKQSARFMPMYTCATS